jgi:energy-coupling factor transporter ATP-binding protein EcfA2
MQLELRELKYRYPGSDGDVFRQLNCQVTEPGFYALFGPSGVGKTTLAKILVALFLIGICMSLYLVFLEWIGKF